MNPYLLNSNPEHQEIHVRKPLFLSTEQKMSIGSNLFRNARNMIANYTPSLTIDTAGDILLTEPPAPDRQPLTHVLTMSRAVAPAETNGHKALVKTNNRTFRLASDVTEKTPSKWLVDPVGASDPTDISQSQLITYLADRIPGNQEVMKALLDSPERSDIEFTNLLINGLGAIALSRVTTDCYDSNNYEYWDTSSIQDAHNKAMLAREKTHPNGQIPGHYEASTASRIAATQKYNLDSTVYQIKLGSNAEIGDSTITRDLDFRILMPNLSDDFNDVIKIEADVVVSSNKLKKYPFDPAKITQQKRAETARVSQIALAEQVFRCIPERFNASIQSVADAFIYPDRLN